MNKPEITPPTYFHHIRDGTHHRAYATRDEVKRDLFSYMEELYNRPSQRTS